MAKYHLLLFCLSYGRLGLWRLAVSKVSTHLKVQNRKDFISSLRTEKHEYKKELFMLKVLRCVFRLLLLLLSAHVHVSLVGNFSSDTYFDNPEVDEPARPARVLGFDIIKAKGRSLSGIY